MTLNDLLRTRGIDPATVMVMRHRPSEPELNKVLPWLAAEQPDVFNAYQQTQTERVEKAMLATSYVAAFIGRESAKAIFVGLYRIGATTPLTREQFWAKPANSELRKFGMRGYGPLVRPRADRLLCPLEGQAGRRVATTRAVMVAEGSQE
jgi:hypothetical protein